VDAADGDTPVSRIPAPASPRDSRAAIPLSRMTAGRVDHRNGLMDGRPPLPGDRRPRPAGRVPPLGDPRRDAGLGERMAGG